MAKQKDALPAPQDKNKGKKPTDEDHEIQGLMSEIESDLREEEFKKLWKQYGNAITAAVVVLLLSVVGWQLWNEYDQNRTMEIARTFEAGAKASQEGRTEEALAEFEKVAKETRSGLGAVAQLDRASLLLQKPDVDGAIAIYRGLASDTAVDPVFRELGAVLWAVHGLDKEDPAELEKALAPVTSGGVFRHSALELTALLAAKQGDRARAVNVLGELINDIDTPASIRARAEELRGLYQAEMTASSSEPAPARQ